LNVYKIFGFKNYTLQPKGSLKEWSLKPNVEVSGVDATFKVMCFSRSLSVIAGILLFHQNELEF
jgi:hypothetical protein